jgi:hypothetical protein
MYKIILQYCKVLLESYAKDKILEMKFYLSYQENRFNFKYATFLDQALSWGWGSKSLYLRSLPLKNPLKLTFMEKFMKEELDELEHIKNEIMALEKMEKEKPIEITIPFPMEEKFKQEYIAKCKHFFKHHTVNLIDTYLIPYEIPKETFMDRLRNLPDIDIDEEIRLCMI